MLRRLLTSVLVTSAAAAQPSTNPNPARLSQELRTALAGDDYNLAAEIAARLDSSVQAHYHAWLNRDARERVDEALTWLPAETEGLLVIQEPTEIGSVTRTLGDDLSLDHAVVPLQSLNNGAFFRALSKKTARLVVAGSTNFARPYSTGDHAASGKDFVYFYYFTEPIDPVIFSRGDDTLFDKPVWRGLTRQEPLPEVGPEGRQQPGPPAEERWVALPRSDLLILASRKDLLGDVLSRMTSGSQSRALPADLPEWKLVNRASLLWGIRHYSEASKPKPGRDAAVPMLPRPDVAAIGAAVNFDSRSQHLEIFYLSPAEIPQKNRYGLANPFKVSSANSAWRLLADVSECPRCGQIALEMLGF